MSEEPVRTAQARASIARSCPSPSRRTSELRDAKGPIRSASSRERMVPRLEPPSSSLPVCPRSRKTSELDGGRKPTNNPKCTPLMPVPTASNPLLPSHSKPLAYIDVFVDDFLGLSQGRRTGRQVRCILLHAIDDVLRPLDDDDCIHRKAPVSLKKLCQGDCSWSTIKTMLSWIIHTVNLTIHLPPHCAQQLADILASIPLTQKQNRVRKWHKVLGELRSMALALPGARHMFSHMLHALTNKLGTQVSFQDKIICALGGIGCRVMTDVKSRLY